MAILPVGIGSEEASYRIERSLRFNSADSADLNRTFSTPTDNNRCTISLWVKKTTNSAGPLDFGFLTTGVNISVVGISGTGAYGASLDNKIFIRNNDTNKDYWYPVLRDNSAWYHIVIAINTDESTQADRAKLWINGVSQASNKQASGFSLSEALTFNTASTVHRIGSIGTSYPTYYSNGYLSEYYFIDGQALDPTSFGEYNSETGVWQPKAYTGSYGTNGFYLDFADNSSTTALGYDAAGSNDWTPNNFSVTAGAGNDSLVDTPTPYGTDTGAGGEVRGNYCTFNYVAQRSANITLTNGNLDAAFGTASGGGGSIGTIAPSSGKWYWEMTVTAASSAAIHIGVLSSVLTTYGGTQYYDPGLTADGYAYQNNGTKYNNNTNTAYGATYTTNDVIGVAMDLDAGTLTFYKNGTSQGQAFSGLSGGYFPAVGDGSIAGTHSLAANFGQRPFAYAAPSGFKALCTQNLPEPAIADGSTAFNAVLYAGTSPSTNSVTGVGFQPDLVWVKSRTSGTRWHENYDVLRPNKKLSSNATDAEYTENMTFDADGFTTSGGLGPNETGNNYVGWCWKAGGAGVTNTAGTITSTVSANTTAGFSIVTYTGNGTNGATIGHGLGVKPAFMIIKYRSNSVPELPNWYVYHQAYGATKYTYLNTTAAADTSSVFLNNTEPTSSLVTLGTAYATNYSGANYVAYAFAPVANYSAFGSYTGNGSADGPFVYTGFRPAFVLIKNSSTTYSWNIFDDKRSNNFNYVDARLYPDLSSAEQSAVEFLDFTSNGFKIRINAASVNGSTNTFIYAAFAENPFKYSLAR